jgi:hypothetical protein
VDIDLSALTRGYTAGPVYLIRFAADGAAALLDDGKTARFTPHASFAGLAEFSFTVTDNEGGSMTRTVGIRVIAPTNPPSFKLTSTTTGLFRGTSGKVYRLQHSTDFTHWTTWKVIAATGSDQTIEVPAHLITGPKDFFRAAIAE